MLLIINNNSICQCVLVKIYLFLLTADLKYLSHRQQLYQKHLVQVVLLAQTGNLDVAVISQVVVHMKICS